MKQLELVLYITLLGLFGLLGVYLQDALLQETPPEPEQAESHEPDYYIENFTATGWDKNGERRFVLEAQRMEHFPLDDTAVFDNPHVIEYQFDQAPRHTYADSGWMPANGDEILLTGNVRVVFEAGEGSAGGAMRAKKMRILLDQNAQDVLF